jgi:hypothetical protein
MMIVLETIDPFFSDLHAWNSQEHCSMPKGARLLLANLHFSTSRDNYSRSMMEKLQAKEKVRIISGLMCEGKALGDSIPNIRGLGQCSSRVHSAPHFLECPHMWVL